MNKDVKSGRLDTATLGANFADMQPPLTRLQAIEESARCLFCFDAPCTEACPTGIDIPGFIRKIATGNVKGAALTILNENIMGGTCANVCPVEELCEQVCVKNTAEEKPVVIGRLQRYATDHLFASGVQPFSRAPESGRHVAVVGAGPAGLACAHCLAMLGHRVTVYEARDKAGGLNEYGIAAYKMVDERAAREVEFILGVGGISIQTGTALGRDLSLQQLRQDHDAVFLGLGHNAVNDLGMEQEHIEGVHNAVDFIERIRQEDLATLPVGRRVVVIGGGNTAIDIAVQIKKLGAEYVTLVYRRGEAEMSATDHEQEIAQTNGVLIKTWAQPLAIRETDGCVSGVEFEYTAHDRNGNLTGTGETFVLPADQVFKAIGQSFESTRLGFGPDDESLAIENRRIHVDPQRRTSLRDVWAGGDCIAGTDLTVVSVQDGKWRPNPYTSISPMADLSCNIAGVRSPNPFWLASAPPTDKQYNVERAFEAGWGGVVWKTLGEEGPPVVNVSSRYGSVDYNGQRMIGLNNIELITDRPLEVNLREIKAVKAAWPDRAMVVSLMVPCEEQAWMKILRQVEQTGCDGVELNFGCPHGMSERGMGSAVGQVPEYIEQVTAWCKIHTDLPVFVKLTPNIANIRYPARAAHAGGADAVSLINTINSIVSIDLDAMAPMPVVAGKGVHGGYCGPAVKPIALSMVSEIARDPETVGLPISGIGGIGTWRDAAEFIALGCGSVQVCTAAMRFGFKIIDDLADGLSNWMDEKGYATLDDFRGKAVPNVTDWQYLDLNYKTIAKIDPDKCIECGLCFVTCEDTSHQSIARSKDTNGKRTYTVIEDECVGCNLCHLVCPVPECITMVEVDNGLPYLNWTKHPNNPLA